VDAVLRVFSLGVCVYIYNKHEKSAYKMTWIFLIMLVPIFGGLLYVILHFQVAPKKLEAAEERARVTYRPDYALPGNRLPELETNHQEMWRGPRYLQEFAGFPLYTHTRTVYFGSGEAYYARMMQELPKAQKYIFMEFFILGIGKMLDSVVEILEEKVREGLDVRVMYDDLGCLTCLPADYQKFLEGKGIKCIKFNPFKPILSSLQNNRDHRKILSIDGKVAFTGGINIADEYINAKERFGHWKDSGLMLEGEGAWGLTMIFLEMWNNGAPRRGEETDQALNFYPWRDAACTIEGKGFVQPYADSPIDTENVGEHVYIQMRNSAKDYLYINTPDLVIDENLLSALTLAAKSGVDVRIVTPHRWD
jgi:cardiolipin synthase